MEENMPIPTLVLCDDRYHPARIPRAGLAALGDSDFVFDWIEHAGDWSAERMAAYPLVVLTKSNHVSSTEHEPWVTAEVEAAFLDYVRRGNGLLAIHSGTAGYQETPLLRGLLGGVFARHPAQCQVTVEPRQGHPLTAGVAPFTLVDEHYMMDMDDSQVDVFLTAHSEHGAQPAGWTRAEGAGRVAVLTPGHNLEIWLHPSYQALIHNCLGWCAGL
jgi:uncharacterized protein